MVISHGYVSLPEVNMSIMGKSQESMRGYGDINGKSIGTNRDTQIMGLRENYRKHQETIRVSIIKIKSLGVPANFAFSHFPVIPHVSLRLGQQCGANFDFPSEAAPWPTAATAKRLTAKHTFEALAVVDVVTSQDLRQVCQVCVTCKFAYLVVQLLA